MDNELKAKIEEALGFKEAMDALDRLVKASTVGGKKEKKPEADNEEKMMHESIKDIANFAREIHEAFEDAGFDDDQSFALTMEMVRSFNNTVIDA